MSSQSLSPTDTILTEQQSTLRDRAICVIIPTYNNAGTIVDVVERSLAQCVDVIVVCDGCTDNTVALLNDMTVKPVIVELKKNQGKGTALKEGFRHALKAGFAYAITLDGDGQHFPEDIPLLLKANQKHPGALIVGERKDLEKAERSGGSKFANAFSNFWFAVQTGCKLKDTQTGYRLYPLKKLHGLSLLTSRYEAELELMVFASWHGVKLVSEPVNVFYPSREERVSHFRPGLDFTRISILNTILCVLAVIYGYPLKLWRGLMNVLRTVFSLLFFLVLTDVIVLPAAFIYLKMGEITNRKRYGLHCLINWFAKVTTIHVGIPGTKFSIGNPHHETFEKPAVIVCNHQSHLDLMTMLVHSKKMVVLTNDWVWNNIYYGYVIRNAEYYPVSAGIENLLPKLKNLVERGYSIAIYPEGTRSEDCHILRFHQGAFHLAQLLNLDVLPMVLYGAGKVLPKKSKHLHKGPIRIEIDRRIPAKELATYGDTLRAQASYMRKYFQRRYTEMCNRIEQDV